MEVKLFTSELRVMECLWDEGPASAKRLSDMLKERIGWSINTSYTVITKCVTKGYIERSEPGFFCKPLLSREEAQAGELETVCNKLFKGDVNELVSCALKNFKLDSKNLDELKLLLYGKKK
ncbi:MAG: BlaI/MecI/CopY family transcriptional regulator [Oscillospiraceae bacterium]|nr:BlaI/MecI/CopY family transcriptional regulator [Oscillospiraceae bacterium]